MPIVRPLEYDLWWFHHTKFPRENRGHGFCKQVRGEKVTWEASFSLWV